MKERRYRSKQLNCIYCAMIAIIAGGYFLFGPILINTAYALRPLAYGEKISNLPVKNLWDEPDWISIMRDLEQDPNGEFPNDKYESVPYGEIPLTVKRSARFLSFFRHRQTGRYIVVQSYNPPKSSPEQHPAKFLFDEKRPGICPAYLFTATRGCTLYLGDDYEWIWETLDSKDMVGNKLENFIDLVRKVVIETLRGGQHKFQHDDLVSVNILILKDAVGEIRDIKITDYDSVSMADENVYPGNYQCVDQSGIAVTVNPEDNKLGIEWCNLPYAKFTGPIVSIIALFSCLEHADFTELTSLRGHVLHSNFKNASFQKCNLKELTADRCVFSYCTIARSSFGNLSDFRKCNFEHVKINETNFNSLRLLESSFIDSTLRNVHFNICTIKETQFDHSIFDGNVMFKECKLLEASFAHTQGVTPSCFSNCVMKNVIFDSSIGHLFEAQYPGIFQIRYDGDRCFVTGTMPNVAAGMNCDALRYETVGDAGDQI